MVAIDEINNNEINNNWMQNTVLIGAVGGRLLRNPESNKSDANVEDSNLHSTNGVILLN